MPIRNLSVIFIAILISLACHYKAHYTRYATVLADAMGQIVEQYIEPVDRRELFEGAMEGMVSRLDPYSGYVTAEGLEELSENILDQEFFGVGIEVVMDRQVVMGHEIERLTVLSPLLESPAYRAGVRAGDVILQIDGKSTEEMTLQDAVEVMRGAPGTTVHLSVLHLGEDEPEEMTIARAPINVDSVIGDMRGPDGRWRFFLEDHPRLGYIRLTTFGEKTAGELAEVLRFEDHPIDGLILDLRGNAGGLLTAAVSVCDLLLEQGVIVTTRDRHGRIDKSFRASRGTTLFRKPLAVLVDRYSASASEISAACLQDHGRAKIVGERTWGKGTIQNVIFLEGGRSAIKLTTLTYWRPSGRNIHRGSDDTEDDDWGVQPDEGYKVQLTDQEYARLLEARRQRYLTLARRHTATATQPETVSGGSGEVAEGGNSDSATATSTQSEPPVVDVQLAKAVEYLESRTQD